jgi:FkbM family methyltransferase
LTTREFEVSSPGGAPLIDFAIVNAFAPFPKVEPVADGFRDVFGSITRVHYLQDSYKHLAGYVYRSVPWEGEGGLHGTSEWVGTLRSVLEAKDTFTVIELGAGWGPWLIGCQKIALQRGIKNIDLIGVEGSAEHYGFMLDNFRTNGLDPDAYQLHHAVAGAKDGVASFPKLHVAQDDYGASAVFDDSERSAAALRGDLEEISSLSLKTLIGERPRVDLIHIDIQGHEEAVIAAGIAVLDTRVRRLVIGTHSRTIEGHLFDLLHAHGWVCESEVPCVIRPTMDGGRYLAADGEQVWRNDRVAGVISG